MIVEILCDAWNVLLKDIGTTESQKTRLGGLIDPSNLFLGLGP